MDNDDQKNLLTEHLMFTDGSSLGNPGPGGWGTVLVLLGERVMELGGGEEHTTNNRMELTALIEGLRRIEAESGDVKIFTDSKYVHLGATEWGDGWIRRGWKTMAKADVENRDLWEVALILLGDRKKFGHITWLRVPGHSGVVGNERCDAIATGFAYATQSSKEIPELFEGDLGDYAVDILNISIDEAALEKRAAGKARAKLKAYSYLSLVDGKLMRHLTWTECEQRVKGKSGVKFKKTLSREDEENVTKSWGIKI